jgi:hypothetical protein
MEKGAKIAIGCVIILIIIISAGASYYYISTPSMTLEPEVVVTNRLWGQINFSRGYGTPDIWYEFDETYTSKYSDKLLTEIIESMKEQAEDLGEDPELLEECLLATDQFDDSEYHKLPCYAEKARYEFYTNHRGKHFDEFEDLNDTERGPTETHRVWIFILNWGFPNEWLDHIKYYVISIEEPSILYYQTCD